MHDLSDEALCARWLENPYFQLFCGEEFFQHKLVFDRSSMTRWRQRMGEEKLVALIQESLSVATKTGAAKPADFSKVIVDTTVQPKAVAHPTDAKLMHRAREKLVALAKKQGVVLRQSYQRVGKYALIAYQRYAHAKQFKRAKRELRRLRTILGRVMRDIARKTRDKAALRDIFVKPLWLAERVRDQRQNQRGRKVYSLHAPEVECIGKGKAHRPYEFGVKVSVATTLNRSKGGQFVAHVQRCRAIPMTAIRWKRSFPTWSARSARASSASSPTAAIAATTRRRSTSSGSSSPARSGASPSRSSANCAADQRSNRSSAISKPSTAWAETISPMPQGDAINAVLAAAGYNFRRLLAWLALLLAAIGDRYRAGNPRTRSDRARALNRVLHGRLTSFSKATARCERATDRSTLRRCKGADRSARASRHRARHDRRRVADHASRRLEDDERRGA